MSPRLWFIVRRVLMTIPILVAMSIFVFLMIRLVPGDPVTTMLGFRATPENVATVRTALGLDEPLVQQYLDWVRGVLAGDFGTDYVTGAPLSELLAQRLPVTLELTVLSMALALLLGVPLGVMAAIRPGAWRRLTGAFVIGAVSIPDFWLGIMVVLVFAGALHVLPPSGYVPFTEDPVGNLRYMALPVITLAVAEAAYILRTTRGAMEETLSAPFITFHRAKGIPHRTIVYRHALRNASLPVVTVVGIQFGVLLGGAIVVESLFALPGLGRLVVTAVNQRNYLVVQGSVLVIATLFVVVNLLTDILYTWLNPRLEGSSQG